MPSLPPCEADSACPRGSSALAPPLMIFLGALVLLALRYELMPFSDPARWFAAARGFPGNLAHSELAYVYPMVLWAGIALVGRFHAFLLNIPILAGLVAALYLLCLRVLAAEARDPRGLRIARVSACAALTLFIATQRDLLLLMANPFRDPLAHLFAVGALLLLAGPTRSRLRDAAAMILLALACSTRETYALLAPFCLAYLLLRDGRPTWSGLRRLSLPLAVGLLALVPLVLQNGLVSGSPLISGQGMRAFAMANSSEPWIELVHFRSNLPGLAEWVRERWLEPFLLLALAGCARAVRRRHRFLLIVCVPGALVHLLLYLCYHTLGDRYLLIVPLLLCPVAACGVQSILLRVGRSGRVAQGLAWTALLLALFSPSDRYSRAPFRIADARAFAATLEGLADRDQPIFGERPVGEFVQCFLDVPGYWIADSRSALPPKRTLAAVRAHGEALYVGSREEARDVLRLFLDVEEFATIPPEHHGLHRMIRLERRSRDVLEVARVRPWSATSATIEVDVPPGAYHLEFNPGRLALYERSFARLMVDDRIVAEACPDSWQVYRVEIPTGGEAAKLVLESDGPVAAKPLFKFSPVSEPVPIRFTRHSLLFAGDRFSKHWVLQRFLNRPRIAREGRLLVPTPDPSKHYLLIFDVTWCHAGSPRGRLQLWTGEHVLFDGVIDQGQSWDAGRVTIGLDPGRFEEPDTWLDWRVSAEPPDSGRVALAVERLELREIEPQGAWSIRLDQPLSEVFVQSGFHAPERWPGGEGRWSGRRGEIVLPPLLAQPSWIVLHGRDPLQGWRDDREAIHVSLDGFRLDGEGNARWEWEGESFRLSLHWPAELPPGVFHRLAIECEPLVPRELGLSADNRSLGLLLERVEIYP